LSLDESNPASRATKATKRPSGEIATQPRQSATPCRASLPPVWPPMLTRTLAPVFDDQT
jgi:hypothetical protein